MGYSPWSHKESDMTEQVCTHSLVLEINASILPTQRHFVQFYGLYFKGSHIQLPSHMTVLI